MPLDQATFDKIFQTVERGTWLNERAQARIPAPQPAPLPPPTALDALAARAAIDSNRAAAAVSANGAGGTWLPSTAGSSGTVSGGGGIAFGQSPGHKAANAGWSTGYGNLKTLGGAANALWGPGEARKYVEGWKFPFYAAKTYEAALSHALIMQKASTFPVEANFWGEVWALTKSAQQHAQGGAKFD